MQTALGHVQFRRCAAFSSVRQQSSRRPVKVLNNAGGSGILQKLGRVLKEKATGDFDRVLKGTSKTRERLGFVEEVMTYWNLDDYEDTLEELEDALIAADFGVDTASKVVGNIREDIKQGRLKTADELRAALKDSIKRLLKKQGRSAELNLQGAPAVILVVGVNGAGKTTTIGKLAYKFSQEGAKVMLAPGDTFRAAAAEQLAEWARRSNAVMGQFREGGKASGVLAQACNDAKQRKDVDIVICDTAGRLHTAYNLMEQLKTCRTSIQNVLPGQPDEVLLVLDGTTGLNMLNQAREFNESVPLTGLILTKLDGSSRGGAVVSVVDQLGVPVKFVGVGEGVEDLQPFSTDAFVDALFPAPVVAAA